MCNLARWQVIKKRRLNCRTIAVIRVETLAGLPVSRFHAFFRMLRSNGNEFLLSSRFADSVEFSLFRFPIFPQFIGQKRTALVRNTHKPTGKTEPHLCVRNH